MRVSKPSVWVPARHWCVVVIELSDGALNPDLRKRQTLPKLQLHHLTKPRAQLQR
jgi:hypothetical protein